MTPDCHAFVDSVQKRQRVARRKAWRLPRTQRQKFIYEQTFRNDIEAVAYQLALGIRRIPDFATPKTYMEKKRALYLIHPNPMMSLAADKIEMRRLCDYLDPPIKPAEMYGAYSDPADLNVSDLPETCYLKINDGCGMNIAHTRGMPVTPLWYRIFLRDWWHLDHWRRHGELHYRDIPRRLLVEEALLPQKSLREIGVFCAHGEPYLFHVRGKNHQGHARFRGHVPLDPKYAIFADKYGDALPMSMVGKPSLFEDILETARRLSRPFAHCRIDFMQNGDRTITGEITLSPGAIWSAGIDEDYNIARGSLIDMERLDDILQEGIRIAGELGWPTEASFGHYDKDDPRLKTAGQ